MNIRHMLASATMLAAFVVTPAAAAEFTTLYSFTGNVAVDGKRPEAGLLLDAAGNLYGTSYGGGAYGYGTVFKLGDVGFALPSIDPGVPGVPEPATWTMLIAGFGLIGGALRRRRVAHA